MTDLSDREDLTKRTAPYTVYHWDTFDNETFKIGEAQTLEDAEALVEKEYGTRVGPHGADRVDIVDLEGIVIRRFKVG